MLLILTAALLTSCAGGQSTFTATEAAEETGSSVTVCDVVADVRPDPISSGPLYLDLVKPAPEQAMTIMIQNRDGAGAIRYLGHEVCASGLVEATGGDLARPRLMVKSPSQVRVAGPAPGVISAAEAAAEPGRVATVCDVIAAFRPDPVSELTGFSTSSGLPLARSSLSLSKTGGSCLRLRAIPARQLVSPAMSQKTGSSCCATPGRYHLPERCLSRLLSKLGLDRLA